VAVSCEYGDEPSGSSATELVTHLFYWDYIFINFVFDILHG
jgi:hypothetical protein